MSEIRKKLNSLLERNYLPDGESLISMCDCATAVLEDENSYYRPKDKKMRSGGLLDFHEGDFSTLPVIVVPDLHARCDFLMHILDYHVFDNPLSVLELLEQGKIMICCVGDIFHSEGREKIRWLTAFEEFCNEEYNGPAMTAEMVENLTLLQMLFVLKTSFPPFFHVLKGNHENVMNSETDGNRPFRKFCDEGNMVCTFLRNHYDDLALHYISCFEKNLPLCAVFKNCIVTHAEPVRAFSRDEIINYHDSPDVTFGLTWTPNDDSFKNTSVLKTSKNLMGRKASKDVLWLAGHRPVLGKYELRQGGSFVQIHNPKEENVAIVLPEKKFNPDTDIVNVLGIS